MVEEEDAGLATPEGSWGGAAEAMMAVLGIYSGRMKRMEDREGSIRLCVRLISRGGMGEESFAPYDARAKCQPSTKHPRRRWVRFNRVVCGTQCLSQRAVGVFGG